MVSKWRIRATDIDPAEADAIAAAIGAVSTDDLAGKADLVGGFVPDAQIPSGIARDSEVTSAVAAAVAALVASAPGALDTLDELAAALGDDANFAATVTAALAAKALATDLAALTARFDQNLLAVGQETMSRDLVNSAGVTMSSGSIKFRFFTARKTETVTQVRVSSGNTAAGATPTTCLLALYSVDGAGDLTRVGVTANDTALFLNTNTPYTRSFTGSFGMTAGVRYAFGVLVVTTFTAPTLSGNVGLGSTAEPGFAPRTAGTISGQTSCLANYTAAQFIAGSQAPYAALLP